MILLLSLALAAEPTHGPFEATGRVLHAVWRTVLSPGDGPRCAFRPTCSRYAVRAVRRDGLLAAPLVFDRLLRDGSAWSYPPDGHGHFLDPLQDHPPAVDLLTGRYCRRLRPGACL